MREDGMIELHDGHFGFAMLEDHGASVQLALLGGGGISWAYTSGYGK